MSRADVVISGIGLYTPAGLTAPETWRRVVAGVPTATVDDDLGDNDWALW